jgi:hypothetical protein
MPASPSLLIVPARFKTGKLYTQIATTSAGLVLGSSGDFNVTRATTATRFNSAGLIESVASGVPRLDYYTSGGTAGCPALLVEPSAQNLALQSQTIDVSGTWVPESGALVSANATGTLSPDGLNTAEILTLVSGGANQLYQTIAMASGTTYTASIFLKNIALTSGQTFLFSTANQDATINQINCTIDLANATITSGSTGAGVTLSNVALDNYGNGWYRARFTFSFAVGNAAARLRLRQNSNVAYNTAFYVWGAQFETGSIATSYIPTTAAAVTRNADVVTLSGAVSGCIGQTEGTIYWEGAINRFDRVFFALSSGTSTTQAVRLQTTGAGLLQGISISGSVQGNPQTSGAVTLGQFYKVAFAYKENDFVLYVNGVLQQSKTSGTLPTNLNSVYFCNSNGTEITDQRCRAAALYTTRLTNAELATLTTP